ncbi:16S rRNA (cytosine(1402)-N(4))-methyltransferase RsmH [Kiritimatiellaeota bacterium B1221]|nr:16S rRNA (cytosine(1402)-N(4))-methyltransferase RsmH [Kiritimatiellaeota bacterium B1221]
MTGTVHEPVLKAEVLEGLGIQSGGRYIDGTLGGGGHTRAILEACGPDGCVMGIDQDPDALARTRRFLESYGDRFQAVHGNFSDIARLAEENGFSQPDGILMDLGVSSDQLDTPERGFSFRFEGPLDMRMDPTSGISVSDWLGSVGLDELTDTLRRLGEERQARRIARAIVKARDEDLLPDTLALADVIEKAVGGRKGSRIHPATKSFQALRMAVNREMEVLEEGLDAAIKLLKPGGRMAVITFHSLEDRAVKKKFRRHEGKEVSLYQGGSEWQGELPKVESVWRKARVATEEEQSRNPRARSAKLRVIEKKEIS